jgi:hypothetical protein
MATTMLFAAVNVYHLVSDSPDVALEPQRVLLSMLFAVVLDLWMPSPLLMIVLFCFIALCAYSLSLAISTQFRAGMRDLMSGYSVVGAKFGPLSAPKK